MVRRHLSRRSVRVLAKPRFRTESPDDHPATSTEERGVRELPRLLPRPRGSDRRSLCLFPVVHVAGVRVCGCHRNHPQVAGDISTECSHTERNDSASARGTKPTRHAGAPRRPLGAAPPPAAQRGPAFALGGQLDADTARDQ